MKKLYIIISLMVMSIYSYTQPIIEHKMDNQWLIGHDVTKMFIDFSDSVPTFSILSNNNYYLEEANTCICDSSGNFLFSFNGCKVLGKNHQVLPNGDSLAYGIFYSVSYGRGLPVSRLSVLLPVPGDTNLFYIIYQKYDTMNYPNGYWGRARNIMYALIDRKLNNGIGEVVTKDNIILTDTMTGGMAITRHANGRDWWVIAPNHKNNIFNTLFISKDGINACNSQIFSNLNTLIVSPHYFSCTFTPDGSKFIMAAYKENCHLCDSGTLYIRVFDFDRCSGQLSNPLEISEQLTEYFRGVSVAVSPNSRYLYMTLIFFEPLLSLYPSKLFQYDLDNVNLFASKQLIDYYNGNLDTANCGLAPLYFSDMQLGPDNKIYIATLCRYLHVINNPDLPGLSCNFVQRQMVLPYWNDLSIPFIPNFRLGAISGSICDSLTVSIEEYKIKQVEIEVYPNPAGNYLYGQVHNLSSVKTYEILLRDPEGKEVIRSTYHNESFSLDISNIAKGMYFLSVLIPDRTLQIKKVVVIR